MDTDGYTPAIDFEKLLRLARKYRPEGLAGERLPSDEQEAEDIREIVCPCMQGNACISNCRD